MGLIQGIEDKKEKNNQECYDCGVELDQGNISDWGYPDVVNENWVNVCVMCHEIRSRSLSSAIKINDKLIPQKDNLTIKQEILDEGWSIQTLKEKEISEISIIH